MGCLPGIELSDLVPTRMASGSLRLQPGSESPLSKAEGRCLCGAVRYEVLAQPARVTFCHCRFCQRSTGSAYLVEPVFAQQDFRVTSGTAKTYEHISEGSGKKVYIHFCAECGTKLYLTFERFAGAVGVYGGTFDDPNWFELTRQNSKHIYLDAAQRGAIIPAGVSTFREHATTPDGRAIAPMVFAEPTPVEEARRRRP